MLLSLASIQKQLLVLQPKCNITDRRTRLASVESLKGSQYSFISDTIKHANFLPIKKRKFRASLLVPACLIVRRMPQFIRTSQAMPKRFNRKWLENYVLVLSVTFSRDARHGLSWRCAKRSAFPRAQWMFHTTFHSQYMPVRNWAWVQDERWTTMWHSAHTQVCNPINQSDSAVNLF